MVTQNGKIKALQPIDFCALLMCNTVVIYCRIIFIHHGERVCVCGCLVLNYSMVRNVVKLKRMVNDYDYDCIYYIYIYKMTMDWTNGKLDLVRCPQIGSNPNRPYKSRAG